MDAKQQHTKQQATWLFAQHCNFEAGAHKEEQLPPDDDIPEIAFVGRSNVGKSSFLNALTGQKTLARISHTPGRTQQINFFSLANMLRLVDMPGYGYAKTSKSKIKAWNQLIHHYLQGRPNLRRVCILIDSRHGLKESDQAIMKLLDECAVTYQILFTKADKSTEKEQHTVQEQLAACSGDHPALHPVSIMTSAKKQIGVDIVKEELAAFVDFNQ